ncbi:MAG: 2-C-methyl-D-erythritol 4-phosphate cytidylyltransferase [Lentisphaeraceae bacterium]|nr:2-C-methyl-D-erythritol 4-phosphate cytidylyltransferase [Lentisphaeraceae bacterium]
MNKINDLGIVVVAAGSSRRFGQEDKLLIDLNNRPLFLHCIATFLKLIPTVNMVIVTSAGREEELQNIIFEQLNEKLTVICGGKERRDSSLNGLKALSDKLRFAGVHDAARPYLTIEMLQDCYASLQEKGSAVLARPVTDTIKIVNSAGLVESTPARHLLAAAETPQIFQRQLLIDAYENAPESLNITDEAMAVETAGHPVALVYHEGNNCKITYSRDIVKTN